jgi:hypothetical protein
MAKLSDFLGGLASSICDARVNSDIQSLRIAEEYVKDDLLKHFSVPRMRIDKVELNIPVAVENLNEKTQKIYHPINKSGFSTKANQQIINSLPVDRLSIEVSKNLKAAIEKNLKKAIEDSANKLEAKIREGQKDDGLKEFSDSIASKTADFIADFYKENKIKIATRELSTMKNKVSKDLQATLKDEIVFKQEVKMLDSVEVIVESNKLRDINPQNVIMIKMIISEQGMEWINMEDKDGKIVNKLMPE